MPRPPPVVPFIQTGNPEMDRLQRFVQQALPGKQDNWVAPTLINGWANFGAPWAGSGYFKDSVGIVHLRGLVKSGTIGAAVFVLPLGYRPVSGQAFAIVSASAFAQCNVNADGTVTAATGSNGSYSLSGISFDTR